MNITLQREKIEELLEVWRNGAGPKQKAEAKAELKKMGLKIYLPGDERLKPTWARRVCSHNIFQMRKGTAFTNPNYEMTKERMAER